MNLFACNHVVSAQPPVYYGVGPMMVTLTGAYILGGGEMPDEPGDLTVTVGAGSMTLKGPELQTQGDDVQQGNAMTPITVTINAYGIA